MSGWGWGEYDYNVTMTGTTFYFSTPNTAGPCGLCMLQNKLTFSGNTINMVGGNCGNAVNAAIISETGGGSAHGHGGNLGYYMGRGDWGPTNTINCSMGGGNPCFQAMTGDSYIHDNIFNITGGATGIAPYAFNYGTSALDWSNTFNMGGGNGIFYQGYGNVNPTIQFNANQFNNLSGTGVVVGGTETTNSSCSISNNVKNSGTGTAVSITDHNNCVQVGNH
jgi:hypothetical protein